jgi:hypothetical protein
MCSKGERERMDWHYETSGHEHIAIAEQLLGKVIDWMEKESSEQYRK